LADAAVERARLTVVPRRRTQAARMPFVMLVSLVLLGGVVGLLLFNTSMQQASFAATSLESQAGSLTARQQTLERELDVLRNPQHIAEQAQGMGMVVSTSPAFLDLGTGKVLGAPAAATAAEGLRIRPRPPVKPLVLNPPPLYVDAAATADSAADTADGSGVTGGADGTNGTERNRSTDRTQR
jgi:cell division protein FtsB